MYNESKHLKEPKKAVINSLYNYLFVSNWNWKPNKYWYPTVSQSQQRLPASDHYNSDSWPALTQEAFNGMRHTTIKCAID
jgi:hypothetical protein